MRSVKTIQAAKTSYIIMSALFCVLGIVLIAFPGIFKGSHIRRTDMVEIRSGQRITVEFDRPTALQIDGETISGVRKYTVTAKSAATCEKIA